MLIFKAIKGTALKYRNIHGKNAQLSEKGITKFSLALSNLKFLATLDLNLGLY